MLRTIVSATLIIATVGLAYPASAVTITQDSASDRRIAFEAESFDSIGVDSNSATTWQLTSDSSLSGGQGLVATGTSQTSGAGEDGSGNDAFVTYKLIFLNEAPSSDPYDLYIRHVAPSGNSLWRANDFDVDPTGNSFSLFDNINNHSDPQWLFSGTYTVDSSELGSEVTFSYKVRETGYVVDRIILTRDSNLTAAQLNATPNSRVIVPEPASLALIGLGSLLILGRRRTA